MTPEFDWATSARRAQPATSMISGRAPRTALTAAERAEKVIAVESGVEREPGTAGRDRPSRQVVAASVAIRHSHRKITVSAQRTALTAAERAETVITR